MSAPDRALIAQALEFYLGTVRWSTGDPERAEYERLLDQYREEEKRDD